MRILVVYYSLTGQYPFNGESVTEVMASHIQGTCDDLQPLRPDLSPALCRWVMRLIARGMEERPESAQEALREFETAKRATAPVPTQPVPSGPRLLTGNEADKFKFKVPTLRNVDMTYPYSSWRGRASPSRTTSACSGWTTSRWPSTSVAVTGARVSWDSAPTLPPRAATLPVAS